MAGQFAEIGAKRARLATEIDAQAEVCRALAEQIGVFLAKNAALTAEVAAWEAVAGTTQSEWQARATAAEDERDGWKETARLYAINIDELTTERDDAKHQTFAAQENGYTQQQLAGHYKDEVEADALRYREQAIRMSEWCTRAEAAEARVVLLLEALEWYLEDDKRSVEQGILESIEDRPASAALAANLRKEAH